MDLLATLLVAQGVVGGLDTLINHEAIARLPQRPEARREIGLHALREANYGAMFAIAAAFAIEGPAARVLVALLAIEIAITAADEWEENRIRVLPQNERLMHVALTLNLGAIAVLALPRAAGGGDWVGMPLAGLGLPLLALAVAAFAWSVRDALAWRWLTSAASPR